MYPSVLSNFDKTDALTKGLASDSLRLSPFWGVVLEIDEKDVGVDRNGRRVLARFCTGRLFCTAVGSQFPRLLGVRGDVYSAALTFRNACEDVVRACPGSQNDMLG